LLQRKEDLNAAIFMQRPRSSTVKIGNSRFSPAPFTYAAPYHQN